MSIDRSDTKTKILGTFLVTAPNLDAFNLLHRGLTYLKFATPRQKNVKHGVVFFYLFYKPDKFTAQPVGINTTEKIPQHIAGFLKLQNINEYSKHSSISFCAFTLVDIGGESPRRVAMNHSGKRMH